MKMSGEELIPAPRERVWAALNDPEVLKVSIPGCEAISKTSDTTLEAKVVAKIGPVKASFTGDVTLSNIRPPHGYTISGQGRGGAAGFAKGTADVSLRDQDGQTLLVYDVDAQVGGKLAQIGSRLVDSTARKMAQDFFTRFAQAVTSAEPAAAEVEAAPPPPAAKPVKKAPARKAAASGKAAAEEAAPETFPAPPPLAGEAAAARSPAPREPAAPWPVAADEVAGSKPPRKAAAKKAAVQKTEEAPAEPPPLAAPAEASPGPAPVAPSPASVPPTSAPAPAKAPDVARPGKPSTVIPEPQSNTIWWVAGAVALLAIAYFILT